MATGATKLGSLVNPYQAKEDAHDQALADEGHKLFGNFGCPGCHGYGGGGGMCPPITNGVWIYGDKDDTLFRLISLGSDATSVSMASRVRRPKISSRRCRRWVA